jgi:N-acetylmuramoyl-L-alanine amidase
MQTNKKYLFVSFIIVLTLSSFTIESNQDSSDRFVVVLDAGHGGHDPGNLGNGFKEKNIALKVILEIGKELEKNPSIKVIYTRKTDVFVTLRGRAKIANEADADLFVSVHCNAHHSQAHGTETFVLGVANTQRNLEIAKKENEVIFLEEDYEKHYDGFDPNSPESTIGLTLMQEEYVDQSILLASLIENNFTNKLKRKSRGVKQTSLWVMHNTYMPSVLVEMGFLTYKKEGLYLNSRKGQTQIASSITKAVLEYKKKLDQNVGDYVFEDNEVNTDNDEVSERIYEDIVFKVQIAAGSRKLAERPYNFKGLEDVSREKKDKIYRYFYGNTSNYSKVVQFQNDAIQKGYESCFIVAYKNGERIALDEALKTSAN